MHKASEKYGILGIGSEADSGTKLTGHCSRQVGKEIVMGEC